MDEPNNDIDTETLQAQIDLSMAYAQNLVASWLPSSSLTHSSSALRAAEAEAELQTLFRRPPRLGVGAPLPETPAPAQTRLVQKLQGGKKHARNMENGVLDPTAANDGNQPEGEEGGDSAEEETRASSAVRKRPRVVDPFESGGKNKKKMKNVVAETAEAAEAVPAKDIPEEEAPPLGSVVATIDATTNSSPKKRKRKRKKHKTEPIPDGQGAQGHTEVLRGSVADVLLVEGSAQSLLDEWDGIGEFQERSRGGTPTRPSSSHSVVPPDVGAPSPTVSPKSQRGSPTVPSVQQAQTTSLFSTHAAFSAPLLNLTGAPSLALEETEGPPPKKRRRKRKKKRPTGDQVAAGGDPP